MSDYAAEREYNRTEKAIVILELIRDKKRITIAEAMREAGCSQSTVYRILLQIERVSRRVSLVDGRIEWCE